MDAEPAADVQELERCAQFSQPDEGGGGLLEVALEGSDVLDLAPEVEVKQLALP